MARNRKRAKERRQTQPVAARPSDLPVGAREPESNGAPDPLAHATPDAELAEAQLAIGRGGVTDDVESDADERELEALATQSTAEGIAEDELEPSTGRRRERRGGELAHAPSPAPAHRPGMVSRFVAFLQGSWAELQRVQWPDRRQVVQATGVVIGFVIVAGLFLGVADFVAGKVMTFILK